MEDLTAALAGNLEIDHKPNNVASPHPRFSQYKQRCSSSDQDSRRKQLLKNQKNRRYDFVQLVRKLTDNVWDEDKKDREDESMEIDKFTVRPGRYYKDQLMLSEWLVEVPSDFATEWIAVLCPVAKRSLIVASRGKTKAYTKSGYCLNEFSSHLPGGYHKNINKGTTILDCLYDEASQTYYIIDLMCWNGHTIYDTETEFRFYWLHDKLKDGECVSEVSNTNPYKFIGLPNFVCCQEDISTAVASAPFCIDGLLFYHKRTHYTFGSTPLVLWLKPYMLQEILGITVPDCQMTHMPKDYSNYADHLKKVEEDKILCKKERHRHKKPFHKMTRNRNKKSEEMEVVGPTGTASEMLESSELVQEDVSISDNI